MLNKSIKRIKRIKRLNGGMVRAGSVQHFRRGKGHSKSGKRSNKRQRTNKRHLRGGMVRAGSIQHFRRGKH